MSASEYLDFFRQCQERGGTYRMFAVDVVDSRFNDFYNENTCRNIASTMSSLTATLRTKYPNIALTETDFLGCTPWDYMLHDNGYLQLGDAYAICYLTENAPDDETILAMFNNLAQDQDISDMIFWHASFADFDTIDYSAGGEMLYMGYCFKILTESLC